MKGSPKLLDLINPLEREECCCVNVKKEEEEEEEETREEKMLELSLGPPGGEWTITDNNNKNHVLKSSPWQTRSRTDHNYLQLQSSHPCTTNKAAIINVSSSTTATTLNSTAVPPNISSAQKRTAPAPVVGWPPVRSFRKNLASGSSSKPALGSPKVVPNLVSSQKPVQNCPKGLFVKVNMEGIPIGRKVDLKSCNSYEKLSHAVDELFKGLLAAQSDSSTGGMKRKEEEGQKTSGLLDESGEYTLVYEDIEGDRMLVGDVPWQMFISTVKRLRVLKSSELRTMLRGSKQGKAPA